MTEFFQTAMGRRYYENTMPELVRQIDRLNDNLERHMERAAEIGDGEERGSSSEGAGVPSRSEAPE